jgi:hypothetical protein
MNEKRFSFQKLIAAWWAITELRWRRRDTSLECHFRRRSRFFAENNGHFESTTHNIQHLSSFASHSARRKWKNNEIAGRVGGVYFIWCICRSEIYGECRGREPLTDSRELVRQGLLSLLRSAAATKSHTARVEDEISGWWPPRAVRGNKSKPRFFARTIWSQKLNLK